MNELVRVPQRQQPGNKTDAVFALPASMPLVLDLAAIPASTPI